MKKGILIFLIVVLSSSVFGYFLVPIPPTTSSSYTDIDFNGTTIYNITNNFTINTSGLMLINGTNSHIQYLTFNTSITPTLSEGQMAYDFANEGLSIGYPLGTTLQVGQEMYKVVTNLDSITLPEGTAVSTIGVSGNREAIVRTNISNTTLAHSFLGIVTSTNCTINQKCLVTTYGDVHDLNTNSYTEGVPLYVGTTIGSLTNVMPDAPNHVVNVGVVTIKNLNNGVISVSPHRGVDLNELDDVDGTPINSTGQILVWNETRKVWDATANLNNLVVGNITLTGNLNLNNSVWDDMQIPILATGKGSKSPTLTTFKNGVQLYSFSEVVLAQENEVFGTLQMSHSYKLGTPIECHLHWACGTTSALNVTWGLEVTKANIGSVFGNTTSYNATQSCGTAYTHNLLDFHDIGNFTTLSGIANFRLWRASSFATDTYHGNDAFGISLDCHYQKDSLGSDEEYTK